MNPLNWEIIETSSDSAMKAYLERAKVPGGWLVRSYQLTFQMSQSITFVIDRLHEWE